MFKDKQICTLMPALVLMFLPHASVPLSVHNPRLSVGHHGTLAEGRDKKPVDVILYYPEPEDFFIHYVDKKQPALIRGAMKSSPAYEKWSEGYFKGKKKLNDTVIIAEPKKETMETNEGQMFTMKFKEFLERYRSDNIFLVDGIPTLLQKDVPLPSILRCKETRKYLIDAALWYSSGGTKSTIRSEPNDEISCLIRGRKDYLLLDYRHYKEKVRIDRGNREYTLVDVDNVDFGKYPELEDVEWMYAALNEGDCLYIPYKWIQQTNSYSNNLDESIAVNFLFKHVHDHRPRNCSKHPNKATVNKFKFPYHVQQKHQKIEIAREEKHRQKILAAKANGTYVKEEEKNEDDEEPDGGFRLSQFHDYIKYKPSKSLSFAQFLERLKKDEDLNALHEQGIDYTLSFKEIAKKIFDAIDVNKDGLLTEKDFTAHSTTAKDTLQKLTKHISQQYQFMLNYIEDYAESKHHEFTIQEFERKQQRKLDEFKKKFTVHDAREF